MTPLAWWWMWCLGALEMMAVLCACVDFRDIQQLLCMSAVAVASGLKQEQNMKEEERAELRTSCVPDRLGETEEQDESEMGRLIIRGAAPRGER